MSLLWSSWVGSNAGELVENVTIMDTIASLPYSIIGKPRKCLNMEMACGHALGGLKLGHATCFPIGSPVSRKLPVACACWIADHMRGHTQGQAFVCRSTYLNTKPPSPSSTALVITIFIRSDSWGTQGSGPRELGPTLSSATNPSPRRDILVK